MPMRHSENRGTRREFLAAGAAAAAALKGAVNAAETGFKPLFNGKDLTGWEGDPFFWKVENGVLVGKTPGIAYNDFLATEQEYADFILRFEILLVDNAGNSGVQFRSRRESGSMAVIGYQADISDVFWGGLYDEHRRRVMLAQPSEALIARAVKRNDWNDYEIHAAGKHIVLKLNGIVMADYTETDDNIPQTGIVAVQAHSGPPIEVRFRNMRIREL